MIKLGSWNIRGLNSPHKQQEVKKLIRDNNLDVVCLLETKVRRNNLSSIKNNCFFNWDYLHNCPDGGGVARVIVA